MEVSSFKLISLKMQILNLSSELAVEVIKFYYPKFVRNMKKFTIICLLCLFSTSAVSVFGQSDVTSQDQPQIDNMVDDAISKIIESIMQADQSIKNVAIWNLETGQNDIINTSLVEEKLTVALIKAGGYQRFKVVDRQALEMRAEKYNLPLPKVFDRRKMIEIGKAINIDGFIYGSIAYK